MKCAYCGREFETTDGRRKYCSKECFYKVVREKCIHNRATAPYKRKCARCGREFEATAGQQKYCSKSCAAGRRLPDKGICPICGKEFEIGRRRKYCSPICSYEAILRDMRQRSAAKYAAKPKPEKVCPTCGAQFKSLRRQKYCSPECQVKHKQALMLQLQSLNEGKQITFQQALEMLNK